MSEKTMRGGHPTNALRLLLSSCCSLLLLSSSSLLLLHARPVIGIQKLALWIDGSEIEQFIGEPFDIHVISDGVVMPYIQDAYYDNVVLLPPEVRLVHFSWMANDGLYLYKFTDLRSLDPGTLYDPLLSIPKFGVIPKEKTVFQMTIPCTGKKTAIASMYIVLHIHNSLLGKAIPGSPIKLHLRKRCIAFESKRVCHDSCLNGGVCNDMGRCDCPKGYYGDQCQYPVCFPACLNNGTCAYPGHCTCAEGYVGESCETAVCSVPCQNGGYCIKVNTCQCVDGFYGDHCEFRQGTCHPPCINGGTCTSNNTCVCLDGYMGQFCQRPYCEQSCGVNGFCADVNKCQCYRGWRGRFCHKTTRNLDKQKDRKVNRKKIRHNRKTRLRRGKREPREKQRVQRDKKRRKKLFIR